MATAFIVRGRSILNNYCLGWHWLWCDIHQRISILTEATPNVNIDILWWIAHHIQFHHSQQLFYNITTTKIDPLYNLKHKFKLRALSLVYDRKSWQPCLRPFSNCQILTTMSTESSVFIIGQGCKSLLFWLMQFQRPFRPQVVAVYLWHWYPFLIRRWCDLGSACAQSDQSLNFMLMIFWNSWIDVCKRQLWSVCSALIQYKNPAGTWRQNDIILTYIRNHYVTYLSVRRRYDVICLLGRFNAHFAEIHNQAILITQARDLNLESNIKWEKNPG